MTQADDRLKVAATRIGQRCELEQTRSEGPGLALLGIAFAAIPGIASCGSLSDPIGCLKDLGELVDALVAVGEE